MVGNISLFCLNRILTITKAYWDVSGAEAAFTTIQKLFSNLSDKSNWLNVKKNLLLTKQTQVHAVKKSGAGIQVTQKTI